MHLDFKDQWLQICLAVASVLLVPVCAMADATSPRPPAPPGYATAEWAVQAVETRAIPVTNLGAPIPESIEVLKDIEYAKVGDRSLTLNVYRPKGLAKPVPGIVVIHGGGWRGGNKSDMHAYALHLAKRGYVAASISYRLTGEATHPAQVTDVKAAVRWMRANAAAYNIDPARIAAMGNSAGGHLSMMLGYCDAKEMEGDYGNTNVSSRVQAVINFYGPTDLTTDYAASHPVVLAMMAEKTYVEAPELYRIESPLFHLTKDDPPTLILHGTIDEVVPISQADMLAGKLAELEIPYEYVRLPDWPHSMDLAKEVHDYCLWHIDRFLEKHLPIAP